MPSHKSYIYAVKPHENAKLELLVGQYLNGTTLANQLQSFEFCP
jgi:hypothetical protein